MITEWYRIRVAFCFVVTVGAFAGILLRMIQLQILPSMQLENLSRRQYRPIVKKTLHRHPIFDRNYEEMAISVPAGSIYARPKLIRNKYRVARLLGINLGGTHEKWLKKITTKKPFVWIQRQVLPEKVKAVSQLNLPGIFVESEPRRVYPNGTLAAHILGFTDVDGRGISGAELKSNSGLSNDDEMSLINKDGKGNASYVLKESMEKDIPLPGIALTIDRRIQSALEEELGQAQKKTGARLVMAVVMDPFTGEIYAMGQTPSFDPNHSKSSEPGLFTNHLLSSLYEPGSTIKPLLVASALQDGRFKRNSIINCGNGKLTIGKDTIGEAETDHKFGSITLERMLQVSSNVGAARLGLSLGTDYVRGVFERFGLFTKTGIQLPGETTSSLRQESDWVPLMLATSSFGQGFAVTPLQMVTAYAPFANGGTLIRPKIFMNEVSPPSSNSEKVKRVLSPTIAQTMREVLKGIVHESGATGTNARITGINVAGKTGTAQKYIAGTGYKNQKYYSSFIGFLPAEHPQLLIGVMVDEPKFPFYASQVAAPLFRTIAERSMQLLDKNPKQMLAAPMLPNENSRKEIQTPDPTNDIFLTNPIDQSWTLPELSGLSIKDAFRLLEKHDTGNITSPIKYIGTGFLVKQDPPAGTRIEPRTQIILHFATDNQVH